MESWGSELLGPWTIPALLLGILVLKLLVDLFLDVIAGTPPPANLSKAWHGHRKPEEKERSMSRLNVVKLSMKGFQGIVVVSIDQIVAVMDDEDGGSDVLIKCDNPIPVRECASEVLRLINESYYQSDGV